MIGTDSLLWTRNYKLALVLAASLPSPSPLVSAIRLDIAGYIFGDGWRSDPGPLPVLYHRPFSLPLPIDCIFWVILVTIWRLLAIPTPLWPWSTLLQWMLSGSYLLQESIYLTTYFT